MRLGGLGFIRWITFAASGSLYVMPTGSLRLR